MKVIRHLLSHVLAILLIILLGFAYYYRSKLFTEQINIQIDGQVNPILEWVGVTPKSRTVIKTEDEVIEDIEISDVANSKLDKSEIDKSIVLTEVVEMTDDSETATEIESSESSVEGSTEESDTTGAIENSHTENKTAESNNEIIELTESPEQDQDSAINEEQSSAIKLENTEAVLSNNSEQEIVETDITAMIDDAISIEDNDSTDAMESIIAAQSNVELVSVSHFDLLNQARLAHQIGKGELSIQLYLELTELYPEDPNVHGELGNIYFSKGQWQQASESFYSAAQQLIKLGRREQLYHLYRVIHGLDKNTADKLLRQIESH